MFKQIRRIRNFGIFAIVGLLPTLYLTTSQIAMAKNGKDKSALLIPNQSKIASANSNVEFLNGTWQGTYICRQGLTNLKLIIKAKTPTNINAVFIFSANASNPTVPSGSFRMKGTYENFKDADISNRLELKATDWISQPSGWVTVDLQGNVSSSEKRIVGNVLHPDCTKFDVVKVRNS